MCVEAIVFLAKQ